MAALGSISIVKRHASCRRLAGEVHPRFRSQIQHVLQRRDREVATDAQASADQVPGDVAAIARGR